MGPHTLNISTKLFETNRKRLVDALQKVKENSTVVLQGGSEVSFYDTDTSYIFKQVGKKWRLTFLIHFFFFFFRNHISIGASV